MHAPLLNAMPCTTHHTLRPACMSDVDQHASYAAHVCIPMLTPVSRIQCTSMSTSTRHRRSIFYVTVAFDRHDTPTRPPGHPHQPHRHVAFTTTLSKRSSDGELGVGGGVMIEVVRACSVLEHALANMPTQSGDLRPSHHGYATVLRETSAHTPRPPFTLHPLTVAYRSRHPQEERQLCL